MTITYGKWRMANSRSRMAEGENDEENRGLKMKGENMMDEDFVKFHDGASLPFAILRFAICIYRAGIYKRGEFSNQSATKRKPMAKYQQFEDLPVWQEAKRLYNIVLDLLEEPGVPLSSGFRNQLDRAALSVSNNIAEGFERSTTNECRRSLRSRAVRPARSVP